MGDAMYMANVIRLDRIRTVESCIKELKDTYWAREEFLKKP